MVSGLAKSSNFAVVPNKIPKEEIISQIGSHPYIDSHQNKQITSDNIQQIAAILCKAKPPSSNITKQERHSPRSEQGYGYYRTFSRQRQHYSHEHVTL